MIRRSTAIAIIAIVLSLIVHFLGLGFASRSQTERSAGDTASDVVALATAFEDFTQAVSEPVPPEPAKPPEPPVETPPEPEQADAPTSQALVASANPQRVAAPDTGSAAVVQPETAGTAGAETGAAPVPETVEPTQGRDAPVAAAPKAPEAGPETAGETPKGNPDAPTVPAEAATTGPAPAPPNAPTPQQVAALPVPVAPVPPVPEPSAVPVVPFENEPVDPETPETIVGPTPETAEISEPDNDSGESSLAVAVSLRPRLRDRAQLEQPGVLHDSTSELSALLTPPSQLIESPLMAYQRGRTDLTFQPGGSTPSGGVGSLEARGPGNSDVTNYAGRVLVHLNRAPPVHVSALGSARVFFEINPDGTLAWVDIIDSTGSQDLDRAAKAQVQNAAPFPRPPGGVSRRLTFVYRVN